MHSCSPGLHLLVDDMQSCTSRCTGSKLEAWQLIDVVVLAADFKRHVDDVEAGLARKTEDLHQYRHKLELELSGRGSALRSSLKYEPSYCSSRRYSRDLQIVMTWQHPYTCCFMNATEIASSFCDVSGQPGRCLIDCGLMGWVKWSCCGIQRLCCCCMPHLLSCVD